jgi:hypothetical protein
MKYAPCVGLGLLLALAGGCDASDDLEHARERWREHQIDDYSFDYRVTGFAPGVDARIVVVDGVVAAVDNRATDFALTRATAPTIEALFDEVDHLSNFSDATTVQWDPEFGFPVSARFDAGSEYTGFAVSGFSPGP